MRNKLGDSCKYVLYSMNVCTSSVVKQLIVINRNQNKSFCLHNMCVLCVYLLVYINTHTYSIYFENMSMYLQVYIYIHIIYIYKYFNIKHIFLIYTHACE